MSESQLDLCVPEMDQVILELAAGLVDKLHQ
jgi:hypothetical protein